MLIYSAQVLEGRFLNQRPLCVYTHTPDGIFVDCIRSGLEVCSAFVNGDMERATTCGAVSRASVARHAWIGWTPLIRVRWLHFRGSGSWVCSMGKAFE